MTPWSTSSCSAVNFRAAIGIRLAKKCLGVTYATLNPKGENHGLDLADRSSCVADRWIADLELQPELGLRSQWGARNRSVDPADLGAPGLYP
jgi:hypothetical protein